MVTAVLPPCTSGVFAPYVPEGVDRYFEHGDVCQRVTATTRSVSNRPRRHYAVWPVTAGTPFRRTSWYVQGSSARGPVHRSTVELASRSQHSHARQCLSLFSCRRYRNVVHISRNAYAAVQPAPFLKTWPCAKRRKKINRSSPGTGFSAATYRYRTSVVCVMHWSRNGRNGF